MGARCPVVSILLNCINSNSSASLSIIGITLSFVLNCNLHINHVVKNLNVNWCSLSTLSLSKYIDKAAAVLGFYITSFSVLFKFVGNLQQACQASTESLAETCKALSMFLKLSAEVEECNKISLHVGLFQSYMVFHNVSEMQKCI